MFKEIVHHDGLDIAGKTIHREAVRGIIINEHTLLMIHSSKNGDYKFPGGGVDGGESYAETLVREIQEECGTKVTRIGQEFGRVIEYNAAVDDDYDVFKMTSVYYFCHIDGVLGEQDLDQYEKDLGFEPVWVNIDTAIHSNTSLLQSNSNDPPPWTKRDTFVLEQVKEQFWTEGNEGIINANFLDNSLYDYNMSVINRIR